MSKKDNGGPAFPFAMDDSGCGDGYQHDGMTLRDYFAGQAAIGIISNGFIINEETRNGKDDSACLAEASYNVADAMLAERKKRS